MELHNREQHNFLYTQGKFTLKMCEFGALMVLESWNQGFRDFLKSLKKSTMQIMESYLQFNGNRMNKLDPSSKITKLSLL